MYGGNNLAVPSTAEAWAERVKDAQKKTLDAIVGEMARLVEQIVQAVEIQSETSPARWK